MPRDRGGTTLATTQGLLFLLLAPLVGVHAGLAYFGLAAVAIFLIGFALTALGFAIAWRMDSSQGFHAVVNMFLIPLWLLSGAVFPVNGASSWISLLMRVNPLTYGMDALRMALFPAAGNVGAGLGLWPSLAVLFAFAAAMFGAALLMASRRRTLPA